MDFFSTTSTLLNVGHSPHLSRPLQETTEKPIAIKRIKTDFILDILIV